MLAALELDPHYVVVLFVREADGSEGLPGDSLVTAPFGVVGGRVRASGRVQVHPDLLGA